MNIAIMQTVRYGAIIRTCTHNYNTTYSKSFCSLTFSIYFLRTRTCAVKYICLLSSPHSMKSLASKLMVAVVIASHAHSQTISRNCTLPCFPRKHFKMMNFLFTLYRVCTFYLLLSILNSFIVLYRFKTRFWHTILHHVVYCSACNVLWPHCDYRAFVSAHIMPRDRKSVV